MFKPTQKLIDNYLSLLHGKYRDIDPNNITNEDIKKLINANFFDGTNLSDKKIVDTLRDLILQKRLKNIDLSDIQFTAQAFTPDEFSPYIPGLEGWTDTVIWPKDKEIDPTKILKDNIHPAEMDTVHKKATGKNISIAIIDQRLYLEHPEYKDRIKHYEIVGDWPNNNSTTPDYHGSLVMGCAVGKNTGTAPDADVYYFASNNWPVNDAPDQEPLQFRHRKYFNMAIQKVLEINKTLPENQKIRFLSCSWGMADDQFREESDKLFNECEKNGIMVLGGFYKHERNKTRQCNKAGRTILTNGQDATEKYKMYPGIPTDFNTNPYYEGGYLYKKHGGSSSTFPYLAGVFACACQDNQIFFMRPNWQDELFKILEETAITDKNGGKMINPIGIRDRVSQIAREMEMNLIKQQSLQNE